MAAIAETWPAQLYDGVSPRPREASFSIDGDRFTLRLAGAEAGVALNHRHIIRHDRVGREYHLEVDPRSIQAPSAKLVVREPGFEEALDRFLELTEDRLGARINRRMRRIPAWGWLLVLLVAAPACYGIITGLFLGAHVLVSIEVEAALGEAVHDLVLTSFPPCDEESLRGELQAMVDELEEPGSPYDCRVTVVRSPEVNAFALPGGRIVVFSGLLERSGSAEEVLGVLAHEVAHVERRHSIKHLLRAMGVLYFMSAAVGGGFEDLEFIEAATEVSGTLLALGHSRQAESEADRVAVEKLHARGRSVDGLIRFFLEIRKDAGLEGMLELLPWLNTHPLTSRRLEALERARANEAFPPRPWRLQGDAWKRISGACAGDPPAERPR